MENDYSYAYNAKAGQGESNGGFQSENDSKNAMTAIPVSTNCKDEKKGRSRKCLAFCCCLPFIVCLICLGVVVVLWQLNVTPLQGIICDNDPISSNMTSVAGLVNCPDDLSIEILASTSPIKVFWEEPTAIGTDGNPASIVSQSHSPGSSFSANSVTSVTYVFDDRYDSQCSFNIAINVDKEISSPDACDCEPNLSIENCPSDFIYKEPAFCDTVPVVWTEPSVTDACGGDVKVEKTHAPGEVFSAGTTNVIYTYTDSLQNQKTCEFEVSVSAIRIEDDTFPPKISNCPEHIYEVLEPSQTTVDIVWDPPTGIDDSGLPVTLHQTHSPGDQFTTGGYELVKYTYTDAAGNEAVCEFAVTVYPYGETVDTVPPTVNGCGNTVVLYAQAGSSADYNVVWPTATDNDGQTPTIITSYQPGIHSFSLGSRTPIGAFYYDTSGNSQRCYRYVFVYLQGSTQSRPTIQNCPQNVYLEIPEGTSTRVCWEEPILTDALGNPLVAVPTYQSHHSGAEFFINGCGEQLVFYRFYYGTAFTECAFSVTIRAIGHENLPGEWTQWYDGDNPSGNCDCDIRDGHNVVAEPCATGEPVDAQCETVTGEDWQSVGLIPSIPEKRGQVAWCCPRRGFACFNRWNTLYNQRCLDYRIRFKCPLPV